MLCWAVGTSVVTKVGAVHGAAHQVTLSIFLPFALLAEAPSVAGQVLTARYTAARNFKRARRIGLKLFAGCVGFGLVGSLVLRGVATVLPAMMAPGASEVQVLLGQTLPHVSLMLPLVGATLCLEGLLVGAGEFRYLCGSMLASTAVATRLILRISSTPGAGVLALWRDGITTLFAIRGFAAAVRLLDTRNGPMWPSEGGDGPRAPAVGT